MMVNIFQTNWLDFLTWTMVVCMVIAAMMGLVKRIGGPSVGEKAKHVFDVPKFLKKAS